MAANDLAATPVAPAPDAPYAPSTPGASVLAEFKTGIAKRLQPPHLRSVPPTVCRRASRTHVICRVAWRNAKHKRVTRAIEVERESDDELVVQPV